MDIIVIILQFVLSLSFLIVTHEGGHFFFAKLFGIRVEKFYLFFDPWFSLFKIKKGETEYGIGWLPLGGYVKISGMIDESMDTEQMKQPVQDYEFRAKPAWQRLLVMLGGVLVNFIEAPLILWMILFTWGDDYIPMTEAKFGFDYCEALKTVGFQDGDKILTVNGKEILQYKEAANAIIFEDECEISVNRNGENVNIKLPHEFFREILKGDGKQQLFAFRYPVVIDSVLPESPAAKAGIMAGDSIVRIDSIVAPSFSQMTGLLSNLADKDINVVTVRSDGNIDTLTAHTDSNGKLGIYCSNPQRWLKRHHIDYSFFEALPAGVSKGWDLLSSYVRQIPMIFTKEGATKVGGFGTIAQMFPSLWNWEAFWFNTAFLAIILAFMNILPIPALDGGHVLFLLIEIVSGRKVSDKVLEVAQTIGMILLLGLVLYANGADIVRWLLG